MIQLDDVTIQSGPFLLRDVSCEIPSGMYGVLMGRTGSGKTTLLEAVCGLKQVVSGAVRIHGDDVTARAPGGREIGFVPQDGALFQAMTVRGHLEFALKLRRWESAKMSQRVAELAKLLQIEPLLDRRPFGLSGGERQRVSLGRALSFFPRVLCLDEPLSALDEETHRDIMALLKRVHEQTKVTVLHVTHSSLEADHLGDCVLRIEAGKVVRTR